MHMSDPEIASGRLCGDTVLFDASYRVKLTHMKARRPCTSSLRSEKFLALQRSVLGHRPCLRGVAHTTFHNQANNRVLHQTTSGGTNDASAVFGRRNEFSFASGSRRTS